MGFHTLVSQHLLKHRGRTNASQFNHSDKLSARLELAKHRERSCDKLVELCEFGVLAHTYHFPLFICSQGPPPASII